MEDLLAIIFKGFFRLIWELCAYILLELGLHKIVEDYKIFVALMTILAFTFIVFLIYYFVLK